MNIYWLVWVPAACACLEFITSWWYNRTMDKRVTFWRESSNEWSKKCDDWKVLCERGQKLADIQKDMLRVRIDMLEGVRSPDEAQKEWRVLAAQGHRILKKMGHKEKGK